MDDDEILLDEMPCDDASVNAVESREMPYAAVLDAVNAEVKIDMKDGFELGAGH